MENLNNIQNNPDSLAEVNDDAVNQQSLAPEQESLNSSVPAMTEEQFRKAVSEAEQRGYLRGRNEAIEATLFSDSTPLDNDSPGDDPEPFPSFLSHLRPGFWD